MPTPVKTGIIFLKINGDLLRAKGSFTYNLGQPLREAIVGHDGVHGYRETPRVPFIEGEITDGADVDVAALQNLTDATVQLELNNGKVIVLRDAWFAGEGNAQTEEGNISARFEGMSAEEIQ